MGRDSHGCCKQLLTANAVICPDSLMDKTGDSGSSDAGSTPVRDANKKRTVKLFAKHRQGVLFYGLRMI